MNVLRCRIDEASGYPGEGAVVLPSSGVPRPRRQHARASARPSAVATRPSAPRAPVPSRRARPASAGAGQRALELGLAHPRPPRDSQALSLAVQVGATLLPAAHLGALLAEGGAGALREVLDRLFARGAGLRLLDVAAGRRALLFGRHGGTCTRRGPG